MPLEDAKFVIDVLAENDFSVLYVTGGETALYPHLVEVVEYGKSKGLITSLTSNGTISETALTRLSPILDFLSVSVDHYDEDVWDSAKNVPGISRQAQSTIKTAVDLGMKVYGITFLNPAWNEEEVERIVNYVNNDLGVSFAMSYPYVSSNASTFKVGGEMRSSQIKAQRRLRNMVAKVLQMKLKGSDVATVAGYLKDVLRAHDQSPMQYPCKAGESAITIDCELNVYPCYKKEKLFNLKERQDLNLKASDNLTCDGKNCLVNCFKEASLASRKTLLRACAEEFFSNPKFYRKIISKNN